MLKPPRLFLHYLDRLKALLQRIEAFDANIALNRLYPDMAPLVQQARSAIDFTLRTSCPLAGREIISFGSGEPTLHGVLEELDLTMTYLAAIPDAEFAAMDTIRVHTVAGFAGLTMPGSEYYLLYAVPNFFFHYTMVYAIARQAGVPLGKADFDGYHTYPPGFSFSDQSDVTAT